ncbi:unnamed protein product [Ostreobium quekettii]|uniref:Peptidase S1 domain-containing protein n=1 Tax=Ostreobium quekettii TaxID=121088 RepID=A0A8S1IMC0_9CHLO|nr:unnamed protein product [Ostreobium quekettii]|eukprot:evm.model.scf_703.2 EVM.evm.TU.scf_703.2   scf_703:49658-55550(-)
MHATGIPFCVALVYLLSRHGAEGRTATEGRIRTQDTAPKGRFPWMVSLRDSYGRHMCGGVVIDPWHALTAAHCLTKLGQHVIMVIGAHTISDADDSKVQVLTSESAFIHPGWTGVFAHGFDAALLRLPREVHVTFPTLASSSDVLPQGAPVAALGWGYICEKEVTELRMATMLEVMDNLDCPGIPYLADSMMCAYSQWEDACEGDSGGPLVQVHAPRATLEKGGPHKDVIHGIVSHGPHCCNEATGGAYTRVSHVMDWINAVRDGKNGWAPVHSVHLPQLVHLLDESRGLVCMGLVIEKHHVLTAAHCTVAMGPNGTVAVDIRAGQYDELGFRVQEFPVKSTFVHPQWTGQPDGYDVALLQLPQSMRALAVPMPLQAPNSSLSGAHVLGFRIHGRPEVAQFKVIDNDHCPNYSEFGGNQFCVCSNLTILEAGGPILSVGANKRGNNKAGGVIGVVSLASYSSAANESTISCTSIEHLHGWIEESVRQKVPGAQVQQLAIALATFALTAFAGYKIGSSFIHCIRARNRCVQRIVAYKESLRARYHTRYHTVHAQGIVTSGR